MTYEESLRHDNFNAASDAMKAGKIVIVVRPDGTRDLVAKLTRKYFRDARGNRQFDYVITGTCYGIIEGWQPLTIFENAREAQDFLLAPAKAAA